MHRKPLLKVDQISIKYKKAMEVFYAVSKVSFEIYEGETLSLVGESGCGKSSIAKAILGISNVNEGMITYKDKVISNHKKKASCKISQEIQMIFQDPYSSLNPRMTIGSIIKEPLIIYKIGDKEYRKKRVEELLNDVKLPLHYKSRYPHELSGGERQRVSIARALISRPKLLICDEPTHALDCSVQASIINLLKDLKDKHGLSLLFISHDLCLVKNLSDRLMVMYGGNIIEQGISETLFKTPFHPFTKKLLSAIPEFGESTIDDSHYDHDMPLQLISSSNRFLNSSIKNLQQSFNLLKKNNKPSNPQKICPYHLRCDKKISECETEEISSSKLSKGHSCTCIFAREAKLKSSHE